MIKELKAKIDAKAKMLDLAIQNLGELAERRAETEKCYRMALSKKMLEYRAEGYPVTIISDMCRGDEEVASLKYERDMAEAYYKKNVETIDAAKHSIETLTSRLKNEFEKGA
jgi:hypothetical protein